MKRSSNQSSEWWDEQTQTLHGRQPLRIEVFLRELAPQLGACQQQARTLERLAAFDRRGTFDSVTINVWGKSICPESAAARTDFGERILEYIDDFETWAANTAGVETLFEESIVECSFTDEHYTKVVLPHLCIAVYADDRVQLVLPCTIDGTTYRVEDFLAAIESWSPIDPELSTSA